MAFSEAVAPGLVSKYLDVTEMLETASALPFTKHCVASNQSNSHPAV